MDYTGILSCIAAILVGIFTILVFIDVLRLSILQKYNRQQCETLQQILYILKKWENDYATRTQEKERAKKEYIQFNWDQIIFKNKLPPTE